MIPALLAAGAAVTLLRQPDGWLVSLPGDPAHRTARIAGHSDRTGRSLLLLSVTSPDFSRLVLSEALLVDSAGGIAATVPFGSFRPLDGDLSPDGRVAAVITQPFQEPDREKGSVLVFDDKGTHLQRKEAAFGGTLLVGDRLFGVLAPAQGEGGFWRLSDGGRAGSPSGAVARRGDGWAVAAKGELGLFDADLAPRAHAALPFQAGVPSGSADGSLVVVSEADSAPPPEGRRVLYFDRQAHPRGMARLRAELGVDAAVAADGSAVLLTAHTREEGPRLITDPGRELTLLLTDGAGKERWRWKGEREDPREHLAELSLAAGGKRAAAIVRGGKESRLLLFDEKGGLSREAPDSAQQVWLDAAGDSLYSLGPDGLSRRAVKSLIESGPRR